MENFPTAAFSDGHSPRRNEHRKDSPGILELCHEGGKLRHRIDSNPDVQVVAGVRSCAYYMEYYLRSIGDQSVLKKMRDACREIVNQKSDS